MGAKSRNFGELFENIFLKVCRLNGCAVTRIPDGCRQLRYNKLIRVKTPFDWIITYKGKTALVDTKTVQGQTFHHSMITDHQADELFNHERSGALAGYVIWTRQSNRIFFIPSSSLIEAQKITGSLSHMHPKATLLGDQNFDVRLIFNERERNEEPVCERELREHGSQKSKVLLS